MTSIEASDINTISAVQTVRVLPAMRLTLHANSTFAKPAVLMCAARAVLFLPCCALLFAVRCTADNANEPCHALPCHATTDCAIGWRQGTLQTLQLRCCLFTSQSVASYRFQNWTVLLQASNSSRRLLAASSADVTTQLNAGSTAAVTTVATDLTRVVSGGDLVVRSICMLAKDMVRPSLHCHWYMQHYTITCAKLLLICCYL